MTKKMKYIGEEERVIPQHGVYKPGDEVDFNETLYATGLFVEKKHRNVEKKDGEE
ncbi:hypothetical protein [Bacillus sp. UNC322MFChir4.1]|uniref:hypothetical protein n=1 Tax=Bacillus sp. UNC322MFChir4.1 TaxID=1449045 RepID=UPI000B0DDDFD|nr:hypothetical protein [Bacillus sp. UNC322MFChir4.1]